MTRSSILLKKARSMTGMTAPVSIPSAVQTSPPVKSDPKTDPASDEEEDTTDDDTEHDDTTAVTPDVSDQEKHTDSESMEEEEESEDETIPSPLSASTPRPSREEARYMEDVIDKAVPITYQKNVRNLYRLIQDQSHGAINWTRDGEVVIEGKRVPGSDIVALLTHAARSKPTKSVPVGYEAFTDTLLKFNPSMKYVSGKRAAARYTPPKSGEGHSKLKWAAHL